MSEDWLEKWYKDKYASASVEKPRSSIWLRIEAGLRSIGVKLQEAGPEPIVERPKASVWEALSAFVDREILLRREAKLRRIRTAFSSVLLVFVPFILADFSNAESWNERNYTAQTESNNSSNISENQVNNNNAAEDFNVPNPVLADNLDLTRQLQIGVIEDLNAGVDQLKASNNSTTQEFGNNDLKSTYLAQLNTISSLDVLPFKYFAHEDAEIRNEEVSVRRNAPRSIQGPWSIGLSANYQMTNLYNPVTRLGLDSKSHITNLYEGNFSFDVSVMRRISSRSAIRLGIRLNDRKAQSYQDFDNAQYLVKDLELNYQTIDFTYQRSLATNILPPRIGIELSSGLYVSYLTSINERVNQQDQKLLSDGFRNYDLGINIGLHGIYRFSRPVHLSFGVFYSNGLINVFEGVDKIPARFYQTYTSSYGASLGVRYLLNR